MSLPPVDVRVGRERARLRALSAVVLLVVAVIAVAGFVVTRQVVHDQEKRLLKQRADEAGIYLSSLFAGINGTLSSIESAAVSTKFAPSTFATTNTPLTTATNGYRTVALIRTTPTPEVAAIAGAPITSLTPEQVGAITSATQNAATKPGSLVATPPFGPQGAR